MTVAEADWLALPDRELLVLADGKFDVFITIDNGFAHQHNLKELTFGIVVVHVTRNSLLCYEPIFNEILLAAETVRAGEVAHIHGLSTP